MGLHAHHNERAEHSVFEFVNRDSIGPLDDLNSDTILALSLLDEPLLLAFVDLNLWDKDKQEAEH
jgi:hypothetical protein